MSEWVTNMKNLEKKELKIPEDKLNLWLNGQWTIYVCTYVQSTTERFKANSSNRKKGFAYIVHSLTNCISKSFSTLYSLNMLN